MSILLTLAITKIESQHQEEDKKEKNWRKSKKIKEMKKKNE